MSTALETVADYVAAARVLLQDVTPVYRYPDADLCLGLSITMADVRRLRPDLFLGDGTTTTLSTVPSYTVVDTTAVPVEPQFRYAVLFSVCAFALTSDEEDVPDTRADKFMKLFRDKLITLDI